MVSTPIKPPENDKDPIWEIYRTFPIIGQNNDGTLYHYQWQKIIDALNVLLSQVSNSGGGVSPLPGGNLHIVEAFTNYTMTTTDDVVLVKITTAPIVITLPQGLDATHTGRVVVIKDALGKSETHYIEIDPGVNYIDSPTGSSNQNEDLINGNFHVEENFAALNFLWAGSYWHVI